MRTVLLCFEQLPACSLGCYGEWNISTPEFDAIASCSTVYDNFYVSPSGSNLWELLGNSHPGMAAFPQRIEQLPDRETWAAFLRDSQSSGAVHFGVRLFSPTPAPAELAQAAKVWLGSSAEEFWSLLKVRPDGDLSKFTHDQLALALAMLPSWQQRFIQHTAEVRKCDTLLGEWLEFLEEDFEEGDVVVIAASTGDQRRIPDDRPKWLKSVSEPVVHLPLIIHHAGRVEPQRESEFLNEETAVKLIFELSGVPESQSDDRLDDVCKTLLRYESEQARATRTDDWLLIERTATPEDNPPAEDDDSGLRLFRKPEDVWEVHDLTSQFPELIENYRATSQLSLNQATAADDH